MSAVILTALQRVHTLPLSLVPPISPNTHQSSQSMACMFKICMCVHACMCVYIYTYTLYKYTYAYTYQERIYYVPGTIEGKNSLPSFSL